MNANATDSTPGKRVSVPFAGHELTAIGEFADADLRPDTANAVRALTFLGLEYWRTRGRPKAQHLGKAGESQEPRP